jgi:hypothetical protein
MVRKPKKKKKKTVESWLMNHQRLILAAIVLASVMLRFGYFVPVSGNISGTRAI